MGLFEVGFGGIMVVGEEGFGRVKGGEGMVGFLERNDGVGSKGGKGKYKRGAGFN